MPEAVRLRFFKVSMIFKLTLWRMGLYSKNQIEIFSVTGKGDDQSKQRRKGMRSKWVVGFMLAVVAVMLIASGAMAAKLLCVSKETLKGEDTVDSCLAKGERFAVVDDYGLVRILSDEEVKLTKAFNPKAFQTRAFGIKFQKEAEPIKPMIGDTPAR
ncbi:MAG: hypothetical protein ACUVXF_08310 [Desulfobaccales bacterium]